MLLLDLVILAVLLFLGWHVMELTKLVVDVLERITSYNWGDEEDA